MPYNMPKVPIQLEGTVHVPLFLVLRSFGAVVCSDAGSLASNELVTIRNPLGGEIGRTKAQQHRIPVEWISAECGMT